MLFFVLCLQSSLLFLYAWYRLWRNVAHFIQVRVQICFKFTKGRWFFWIFLSFLFNNFKNYRPFFFQLRTNLENLKKLHKNIPPFKENNNTNNKVCKQCYYFMKILGYKCLNHKCVFGYKWGKKNHSICVNHGTHSLSIFIHKTFQIVYRNVCIIFKFLKHNQVIHLLWWFQLHQRIIVCIA